MAKIMIVDDDREILMALSVRLRREGFNVIPCHRASEACQVVVHERPDAIVLDIDMPHFTGLELHECLNLAERTRAIPVIYVSGSVSPSDRQVAFRQGARAFLPKPFEFQALLDTVRCVLDAGSEHPPVN